MLKLEDLFYLIAAVIMYKAYSKSLPFAMKELFEPRESKYEVRGTAIFKNKYARTKANDRCISVTGVNIWNKLDNDLKLSTSIKIFKRTYKAKMIESYATILES